MKDFNFKIREFLNNSIKKHKQLIVKKADNFQKKIKKIKKGE